jgi:hypothetical protein
LVLRLIRQQIRFATSRRSFSSIFISEAPTNIRASMRQIGMELVADGVSFFMAFILHYHR